MGAVSFFCQAYESLNLSILLQAARFLSHDARVAIEHQAAANLGRTIFDALPPHLYFAGSAISHALGPAFAVLLFARVDVLGVAWLRIAAAALVLSAWCRPWRLARQLNRRHLILLVGMGAALAVMNVAFYLAINRIPLATVSAIECLGPLVLAAWGARSLRNLGAVGAAAIGAVLLTGVRFVNEPVGMLLAFANAILFAVYVVLGHRIVREKVGRTIERLAISMVFALVIVTPIGLMDAVPALRDARLVAAGVGVGICSSSSPGSVPT